MILEKGSLRVWCCGLGGSRGGRVRVWDLGLWGCGLRHACSCQAKLQAAGISITGATPYRRIGTRGGVLRSNSETSHRRPSADQLQDHIAHMRLFSLVFSQEATGLRVQVETKLCCTRSRQA